MSNSQPAVTIDSVSTRDMDDAFWVQKHEDHWGIQVYIADVAKVIRLGSTLDERAHSRVATRYLPGAKTYPMLPWTYSEDHLSLWPDKFRNVLAVSIKLLPDLSVQHVEVRKTSIKSGAKLSYEEVPTLLTSTDSPWSAMLNATKTLSLQLLEKRRSLGALVLYDLNTGWVTTEEGYLCKLTKREDTVGYVMVQELMILANACVAEFAIKNDIPVLFRDHIARAAAPDRVELMRQVNDAIHEAMHDSRSDLSMIRQRTHMLLDRARYSATVSGHYGLNLAAYLHFTSPIRRLPDLINHRQIRAFLKKEPFPYSKEKLEELATHINEITEKVKQGKSDYLKEQASTRAIQKVEQGREVNDKELERIVKIEIRSKGAPSETVAEEMLLRHREGRLPVVCLTVLFTEFTDAWWPLRQKLVETLKPETAVSVLTMASQMGWHSVSYEETPRSSQGFGYCVTAILHPTLLNQYQVTEYGPSKKEAKQRASLALLARIAGLEPVMVEKTTMKPVINGGQDPISTLQEWAQTQGIALPNYLFSEPEGAPHAPVFSCRCECFGVMGQGKAASKKEAKKAAAQRTLLALSEASNDSSLRV